MKWLYLCNDLGIPLDGTKGASEHVRAITRALCGAGIDVQVLAARGALPEGHPARQLEATFGGQARTLADCVRAWLADAQLPSGLGSEVGQILSESLMHAFLTRSSDVLAPDVILERLSLFSCSAHLFARRTGAVYLVEMNAPLAQEASRYRDATMQKLALNVERSALQAADCVITVSEALRQYTIEQFELDAARVRCIPNGVELTQFRASHDPRAARRLVGIPVDAIVFGFVGTLRAWHGIDMLLQAFNLLADKIPEAHLLVVGDGRKADDYRANAARMGLSGRITFHGEARHEDVPQLMAAMDVGVAPYLPLESFYFSPLKLYEYMAAGLCVIASRAGQINEVLSEDVNGMLVQPGDASDLSRAMLHAAANPSLRRRLGAAARESVADRDWSSVASRIVEAAKWARGRMTERRREESRVA